MMQLYCGTPDPTPRPQPARPAAAPAHNRKLSGASSLQQVDGTGQRGKEAAQVQLGSGNTADQLGATATPTEQAWLLVDIAISRRDAGDFVARVSFDDEAS